MRHQKIRNTFFRINKFSKNIVGNMVVSFVKNGFVKTTLTRAKKLQKIVEKLISFSKQRNNRLIFFIKQKLLSFLVTKEVANIFVHKLFFFYKNRIGGYTKIIKSSYRFGDKAQLAYLIFS